jgi:cytochrome c-type biogenesis protein CcmH/NrfF
MKVLHAMLFPYARPRGLMDKRPLHLVLIVVIAFTMLGAGSPSTRFDKIGHNLMCTCGCAEILLECNHVGCPDSPGLIAELHTQVDAGASDSSIFQSFAAKYGPIVLAAPIRGGFDDVAWIVPFAILIFGILGIVLVVRFWQRRHTRLAPALPDAPPTPATAALRDRIRDETKYGE